ncbi:glycosyltransferase family 4 protein [Riemerella anatipestifer]|uniref:glycosyltransferase family 4 protein n=1 Tax=Riemerella anatipestifer TaxID=34085 RepID=UPI002A8AF1CE|nr:glycosyltransferase family 4 protein [Riemerella anatipestifer]
MRRIAIVVQRYGKEVNGGAEFHARILAQKLAEDNEVNILTTNALDYKDWRGFYEVGEDEIDGIKVIRFSSKKRNHKTYRKYRRIILGKTKIQKLLGFLGVLSFFKKNTNWFRVTDKDCEKWLKHQGPYCPDLVDFVQRKKESYDAFIFFTYLYYPTVTAMPLVGEKSIFIPTAHDEPPLYTKPYKDIFSKPRFIMYNTEEERKLVEKNFTNACKNSEVAGVGIEKYKKTSDEVIIEGLESPYFIYVGRIDVSKGCEEMINHFLEAKKNPYLANVKLVLVGKNFMRKQYRHPDIVYTGFVEENVKYQLLRNAIAMIMPSFYESLSMVTLEAMMERVPVIVNGKCEVLASHIAKSNSGAVYRNNNDFTDCLISYLLKEQMFLEAEKDNAERYVLENYSWGAVINKFDKAFNLIASS